ncbi:MAG: DUF4145 domain-containing protein [Anaerolineaceae bacterium]|nr:DUF4145 domain-containing protein [Anaerolineaceae bacterium]
MASNIVPPEYGKDAFNCSHCGVYSSQLWMSQNRLDHLLQFLLQEQEIRVDLRSRGIELSVCRHCQETSVWNVWEEGPVAVRHDNTTYRKRVGRLIFPRVFAAPPPSDDMPDEIKVDYLEARNIVRASPRGAAALLRLCIQKLMPILGEKGDNLNDNIRSLVETGLRPEIQMALDSVRVIGNEAVHPGVLDLKDDEDTALAMFGLINLIVEHAITAKKRAEAAYGLLPQSKRDAIAKRDGKQTTENAK